MVIADKKYQHLMLYVVILSIFLIRSWDSLALPDLESEDGKFMLGYYFNKPFMESIIVPYNGYVSYTPNLLAWMTSKLPLTWVPRILTLESFLLCALAFFTLSNRGLAWLVPVKTHRNAIAIILALLPLGRDPLVSSLTYSQWNLFIIAISTVIIYPLPSMSFGLFLWSALLCFAALSMPLSIILMPFLVGQFFLHKELRQRLTVVMVIIVLALYQFFWVEHSGRMDISIAKFLFSFKVFLSRVMFESFLGAKVTTLLVANGLSGYVYCFGLIFVLGLLSMIISGDQRTKNFVIFCVAVSLAFLVVFISVMVRCTTLDERIYWLTEPTLQRYFYVSKVIVVFLFGWRLSRLIDPGYLSNKLLSSLLCVSAVIYLFAVNYSNKFLYSNNPAEGLRIGQLVAEASEEYRKKQIGLPYTNIHKLDRGGAWTFTLSLDEHTR